MKNSVSSHFFFPPFVSSEKYNYSQQIFLAEELDGPKHINSISLHYAYSQLIYQKEL